MSDPTIMQKIRELNHKIELYADLNQDCEELIRSLEARYVKDQQDVAIQFATLRKQIEELISITSRRGY